MRSDEIIAYGFIVMVFLLGMFCGMILTRWAIYKADKETD